MQSNHDARLAVLIDADNTSPQWADAIFEEVATLGEASVRRIYGDFSGTQLRGWQEKLAAHSVIPHQQFAYTKGKNSSDIALVIDAMDLLHNGRFSGFVLVSSDSDFTRLGEPHSGTGIADVFGIGKEEDAGRVPQGACTRFIFVENLLADPDAGAGGQRPAPDRYNFGHRAGTGADQKVDHRAARTCPRRRRLRLVSRRHAPESAESMRKQTPSKAVPLIAAAMRNHDEDWVPLSVIGSHIHAANPDFDARTYGCPKLTDLLEKTGQFEVRRDQMPVVARQKKLQ